MNTRAAPGPSYTEAQLREAAEWFVIVHAENDPKAESIQGWLRWMDQDAGCRAAFDAVAQAWHATPAGSAAQMPSTAELLADDYDGESSVSEWLEASSIATERPAAVAAPIAASRARVSRRVWLAAAAVFAAMAIGLVANLALQPHEPRADTFATRTGEQSEIALADGSRVWLGPKSRLLVSLDSERRFIHLTAGEAFFVVTKDASRPFTVRSAGGDIVALGTAFNVRAIDEHVTVAVSEGAVAVMPKSQLAAARPASVRVASGQELTFSARQPVKALAIVQSSALGERARWRDGVLVYRNEPLAAVVNDIVRYSGVHIEIPDQAVGDLHYTGVVYRDAVHEWVAALPEAFPVTVVSDGSREVIRAR